MSVSVYFSSLQVEEDYELTWQNPRTGGCVLTAELSPRVFPVFIYL